jgi:hypothetical protein
MKKIEELLKMKKIEELLKMKKIKNCTLSANTQILFDLIDTQNSLKIIRKYERLKYEIRLQIYRKISRIFPLKARIN